MRSVGCAICGRHPGVDERLQGRRLVPRALFERGVFDFDPLGTAGAEVALCPGCVTVLSSPMLLTEDVTRLAAIVGLHREQHGDVKGREDEAARARLLHRAIHLGLHALYGEVSVKAPVAAPRPEPAQMGLFSSKTARFAKIEEALEACDLVAALAAAEELARRYDLEEAKYLCARLPTLEKRLAAAEADPETLSRLAAGASALVEPERAGVSISRAFELGLKRRAARAAEESGFPAAKVGAMWLSAEAFDEARVAYARVAREDEAFGEAQVALGRLAWARGEKAAAREAWRRAFACAPEKVRPDQLDDDAVVDLLEVAAELELSPPAAWMPMVGFLEGIFELPREVEEAGVVAEFHAAALVAQKSRDVGSRRTMRRLAPKLFDALKEAGKLVGGRS